MYLHRWDRKKEGLSQYQWDRKKKIMFQSHLHMQTVEISILQLDRKEEEMFLSQSERKNKVNCHQDDPAAVSPRTD
jgi:hypothetical protein